MERHSKKTIGIVGARGYTGAELIKLIAGHRHFALTFVSSRERDGERVADHVPAAPRTLRYERLDACSVAAKGADAVVLALPNGAAAPFSAALEAGTTVVDLSADHRADDAWYYGLPELTRQRYSGQTRISNPGCYATAMQLAIAPLKGMLAAPPVCFGVSGYSGAGTAASPRNDPEQVRDNLMPYALTGHGHEREATRQLGVAVAFLPHVAAYFRGIMLTAHLPLRRAVDSAALKSLYVRRYAGEPLVRVQDEAPWVSRIAHKHHAEVGGFAVAADGSRAVVVVALDNLLKGAATQALQNLNLAFGFDEFEGISYE